MKNAEFEKLLKQSLHDAPCGEAGLEDTILLARMQASQKYKRERIPLRRFLVKQVRYIGWRFWGAQVLMLLLFDQMVTELYGERFWDSPLSASRLLLCVSTLVAMMALPLLYRARKYRMQEIESAAYFSSVKLLLAKLTVIGIGDLFLLAGMLLTAMVRTSMAAGNLTFCLLLPFLTMTAAYLYMLGHCSGDGFLWGSITLGTALLLLAVGLPGRWLPIFRQSMTLGAAVLCVGLLAFSAEQLCYLLRRSPYTELQIT